MENISAKIIDIVKENFPNGVRDDYIDMNKIFRIYSAQYPDENISREFISEVVRENGIANGNRFYFISENDIEQLLFVSDEIFEVHSVIFYSTLFEKHSDFFSRLNIFSPEILRKILSANDDKHFYFPEFCSSERMTRVDYEIAKVFAESENSLSPEDLQKKFPYVPGEKISEVISDTKKYLPTTDGKFFPVSKIQFDLPEIEKATQRILFYNAAQGYALPENYDLTSNFALNPDIAEKNLLTLIYEKFLSDKFVKRGKKIIKKGNPVRTGKTGKVAEQLKEFLTSRDEVTFDKLLAFVRNAGNNPSTVVFMALEYGNKYMIRVSENLFVKNSSVSFDVAGIDEALTSFVGEKIIPLRAVTSFTGFPPVEGYAWNLHLLESFLRHYSKKFSYDKPATNNASAGAIYPKSMRFENYFDVQVAAVIQEKIPLEKNSVEEFLVGQGYRLKRIDKLTSEIIEAAQKILNR